MLAEIGARIAWRVRQFDDGAQALVDAGSFALQRRGVPKSAQLAAGHLVLCALSMAAAVDAHRASSPLPVCLTIVGVGVFWFVLGVGVYHREREREAWAVAFPVPRFWLSRCLGWWLVLQSLFEWCAIRFDGRQVASACTLFVLVHLVNTPNRPPPRKEARRPVFVPVPGEA